VQIPLDADARHDFTAMAAAITPRTRLILICTPNNPTGPVVHQDELDAFLDTVPGDILVVIDEAYLEFVTDHRAQDGLATYAGRPNVAILRTFSKAYGLAGLRVGYAVAHEPVAQALRKTALPFSVSTIAQRAAIASLDAFDELKERVDGLVAERERVVAELRYQGWHVPQAQANFVWLPLGADTMAFASAADKAGLVVRAFPSEGARCTIAETRANDLLLHVARDFLVARTF
jgi:histidinol-phosphate aminotransferase